MMNSVLFLIFHMIVFSKAVGPELTFKCDDTGKITLDDIQVNSQPIDYTKVTIESSDHTATCHPTDKSLTGCNNMLHSLTLRYQDDTETHIVGGKNYYVYELVCIDTGVYNVSPITMTFNKQTPTAHTVTAQQSHKIMLSLFDQKGITATDVVLGQELTLKMKITDTGYKLSPINCTANNGNQKYLFWKRGDSCSHDKSIVEEKWTVSEKELSIVMYAFRFSSGNNVNIECFTNVCLLKDSCNQDCFKTPSQLVTQTPKTTTLSRRRRSILSRNETSNTYIRNARVSFTVKDENINNAKKGLVMDQSMYLLFLLTSVALSRRWV